MKRLLVITFSLLFIFSAFAISSSAEEKHDISQFEFPIPQAPNYFIFTDGNASEGHHDDLRMYAVIDRDVLELTSEFYNDSDAFYEKYGLWSFVLSVQYDVSLDGEGNWQYTEEWDTTPYTSGYADGYPYMTPGSKMIEGFEFFWLTYYEGTEGSAFEPYKPAITTYVYHDEAWPEDWNENIYSFDTENHSLYIRCRYYMEWEPRVMYDEYEGPGEKQSRFSDWSESAIFGKNSTQIIPEQPTGYEAPVISELSIEQEEDGDNYNITFLQSTPDSVWDAYLYYEMNDYFEPFNLESQVSVNGGDWISGNVANASWATRDGKRVLVFDGYEDLTPDTNVKLRVRFTGPLGSSPWSNILEANAGELTFSDVKPHHWFAESVQYCVDMGYVNGMTETTFVPNGNLTRAQYITILANVHGADLTQYENAVSGFEDVKNSHWYNKAVCWAVENKITSGLSATKFGPNNDVTRAQLARFFYTYSEMNGVSLDGRADLSTYPDEKKVPAWARDSVEWAVDAGLISGVAKNGKDYLDPNGTATRAQATVMFKAFDDFRNQSSEE